MGEVEHRHPEQLDGAKVYHVVTTADAARVMSDLVKALNNPASQRRRAAARAALGQLQARDPAQLKSLEKALASASVQEWIDAATFRVDQGGFDAKLRFGSGPERDRPRHATSPTR